MINKAARQRFVLAVGLPLAAVVGVLVGAALASRIGAAGMRDLVVLSVGGIISTLIAQRTLPVRSRPLIPAVGVQGAHAVLLIATVIGHSQWGGLVDVVALVGPLVWVSVRPERLPGTILVVSHGVQAVLLLLQWASAVNPGFLVPLLISHLSLRLAGALLTAHALQSIWRHDRRRSRTE